MIILSSAHQTPEKSMTSSADSTHLQAFRKCRKSAETKTSTLDGSPLSSFHLEQDRHSQTGACEKEHSHAVEVCKRSHHMESIVLSAPKSGVPTWTSQAQPCPAFMSHLFWCCGLV